VAPAGRLALVAPEAEAVLAGSVPTNAPTTSIARRTSTALPCRAVVLGPARRGPPFAPSYMLLFAAAMETPTTTNARQSERVCASRRLAVVRALTTARAWGPNIAPARAVEQRGCARRGPPFAPKYMILSAAVTVRPTAIAAMRLRTGSESISAASVPDQPIQQFRRDRVHGR
jgi:hypothetical protein